MTSTSVSYTSIKDAELTPIVRFLIIIAVMSATLIQVLDMTIVNVALPHIQGSLSATPDQISWTLTSYLIASAIFMPLTGYFSARFGRKNYLLLCVSGFTLLSMLCGAAHTLTEMVVFRMLQGVFGAGLVPLSQSIMVDIYPTKDMGKAMAIWGGGVMIGPILGPTIGGYLTEFANWRWIFYVNIPVGILALSLIGSLFPDEKKIKRNMDWVGFVFLSLAIGSFQYFLDKGNQNDWLDSWNMRIILFIAISSLIVFVIDNLRKQEAMVFDARIFKDRNFTLATFLLLMLGVGLFGNMVILPLLLQSLLHYPAVTTGLIMAPRGICTMITMVLIGRLSNKIDPRLIIAIGILLCAFASYVCATHYTRDVTTWWLVWPTLLQGFGLGMVFVPLSTIAFSTLPQKHRIDAAGLYSLLRTFGSSIGISIVLTIFTRQNQIAWHRLSGFIQPYNDALYRYLQPLNLVPAHPASVALLKGELASQAQMIAFVNSFAFIMWSFLIMLPFLLFFKYKKAKDAVEKDAASYE